MNYFELLKLPTSVDIDLKAAEQRHRELSLQYHPDRQPPGDLRARREAADTSARLNDAIRTVRDPIRRAVYLLKLQGVDLESESNAVRQAATPQLLEEIMSFREALDLVREIKSVARIESTLKAANDRRQRAQETAFAALRIGDTALATQALVEVRYWSRLAEETESAIEEMTT